MQSVKNKKPTFLLPFLYTFLDKKKLAVFDKYTLNIICNLFNKYNMLNMLNLLYKVNLCRIL